MTKLRRICLAFARWRERRAWAACKRWGRAGWYLHGMCVRDGDASVFEGPPLEARTTYFLRPGWRDHVVGGPDPGTPPGPSVENIRKAGGA
jgi:hypothetical protein